MPAEKIFARTFCCCIAVRAGVVILALIGIIGGGGMAAICCLHLTHATLTDANRITDGIIIAVYAALALLSFIGLIGAFGKKRGLVNVYFVALLGHLIFSAALGAYAIYRTFTGSSEYLSDCLGGIEDVSIQKVCQESDVLVKCVVVGANTVAWLLEIWGCVIVFKYSKQLGDEDGAKAVLKDNEVW